MKLEGKAAPTTITEFLIHGGHVLFPFRNTVILQCFDAVGKGKYYNNSSQKLLLGSDHN